MPLHSRRLLIRSLLGCLLIGSLIFGLSLRKIERIPLSPKPIGFDGQRSWTYMRDLSKGFPYRLPWHENRRKAGAWIKEQFRSMGYTPQGQVFSEVVAGKQYTDLENIYAEKRGTQFPDEIILAVGHYDTTDTTVEGAMDDASGVAVALELARVLAKEQTSRTIIFMATDSEEFGAFWGAREFARNFPRAGQVVAALNFDFVAPENQTAILTLCDGLKQGYTPLWLRELALDSLRSFGAVKPLDLQHVVEFAERAIKIPPADHGAFLQAGIPSFTWVGQTSNLAHMMGHYHHTHADVAEAMLPKSMADYGQAAERLLRSVDEMPKLPEDFRNGEYWKVTDHRYLPGGAALALHILAFIPFVLFTSDRFFRTVKSRSAARLRQVFLTEAKSVLITLGSLLLGYVIVLLLPPLNVIDQYETYPATQKSAILYNPNFMAMGLVAIAVAGVYFLLRRVFREKEDSVGYAEIRRSLHGIILTVIIVFGLYQNSWLTVLTLLPPAYLWVGLRANRKVESRALNALLLAGGAITMVICMVILGTIFHIGAVYWYMFLAAAYGLISAYAVVVFMIVVTIMVRLFRAFVW